MLTTIIDTDLGEDVDDLIALYLAGALQEDKQMDVRAILLSNARPQATMLARYLASHLDLPATIGCPTARSGASKKLNYLPLVDLIYDRVQRERDFKGVAPVDHCEAVLTKTLSEAEDASVQLVMIGSSANIALYLSKSEQRELFNRKVSRIVMMAGDFERARVETNVGLDPEAFRDVLETFEGNIFFCQSPLGKRLNFDPRPLDELWNPHHWPLLQGITMFKRVENARPAWDPATIAFASGQCDHIFDISQPSKVTLNQHDHTEVTPKPGGKHFVVDLKADDDAAVFNEFLSSRVKRPSKKPVAYYDIYRH